MLTSANEGTPNALLEAMARGVACVAFDVGAVGEVLTGDCAAGLVADGNEDAMAAVVMRLLDDRSARERYGELLASRVREDLGLDRSMERYEQVLASLC